MVARIFFLIFDQKIVKHRSMYLRKSAKNAKKATVPPGRLVATRTGRLHMFMEALAGLQQVNAGILQRIDQLEVQTAPKATRSGYN